MGKTTSEDVRKAIELTYKAIDVDEEIAIPWLIVWPETMLPGCGFELSRLDFAPWMESFLPVFGIGRKKSNYSQKKFKFRFCWHSNLARCHNSRRMEIAFELNQALSTTLQSW